MASITGEDPVSSSAQSKKNLEKIKTEYTNALKQMCLTQSKDEDPYLISMAEKQDLIKSIWKEGIKSNNTNLSDKNYKNPFDDKYKVVTHSGLFNVQVKHEGKYKLMIPYERLFNTVWPIHIKHNHDIPDTVIDAIQRKYFVPESAILELNKYCTICKPKQTPAKPYYCCNLDLIIMDTNDHGFETIMVCQDVHSNFIHLRPLTAHNTDNQICLELFKIFMDFGPPKKLIISNPIFEFAINKFHKLTAITPFHINIVRKNYREKQMSHIKSSLYKWSADSKSNNWAIGCYAVQHQLNSKNQGNPQSAAFENVFVYNGPLMNMVKCNKSCSEEKLDTKLYASSSKTDKSREEPVVMSVDVGTQCDDLAKETNDIPENFGLQEKEEMISDLSSNGSNCANLDDDIVDFEYPKCIEIDDSDVSLDDNEDSKSVEFKEPDIMILKDENAITSELEKESENEEEIPKTAQPIAIVDENSNSSELTEKSDAILNENDVGSLNSVEILVHKEPERILSDNVSKGVEVPTELVVIDDDIAKPDEQTKESESILDEDDPKRAETVVVSPDATQPDAIINIIDLICPESIENDPKRILSDKGDVEMKTDSNVTLNDNSEIRENLDVVTDDSKGDEMEIDPVTIISDKDPISTDTQTNATLNDNILKHGEVIEETVSILNKDNPKCDKMDIDSGAIVTGIDSKCAERQTEANATLDDETSKHRLTEKPNNIILDKDQEVAVIEMDDLANYEEVNGRLKVGSPKPTESDPRPSLTTTKPDSPKPSTSGISSFGNVDYDSDDSDIVLVNEDPLA
ncbi:uncharacterized protein LOC118279378 [Spodoptera frugiperda]|uniref:Uncharacterized protein LOC118279378 n=1 Tax=Spodoptera frugiperda TaxID=7108 RepID=A0A9R0DIC8_SPOFR|nr:uncharacterized protein LOC118279378 [Spodoptera frugiperda]